MAGLVLRRLAQLPLIILVIYTVTFFLAWQVPGSPLDNPDGRRPDPMVLEQLEKQYNLDSPGRAYVSLLYNATGAKWLHTTITGDTASRPEYVFYLGPSLKRLDRTVNDILAESVPVSITLGAVAIMIALVVGVTSGVLGAIRPNSAVDLATLGVALVGVSVPSFVVGTLLLFLFSAELGLFPVADWGPHGAVLPAVTLSLPFAAYIARLTRLGMIDAFSSDYVRTARAKGATELSVVLRHALKNAFLPVLSFLGPALALAMTGSFVVEKVFTVPGMGQHFVSGVLNKDLTLIMGVVLVFSTLLIIFNLIVDVLYKWVDPRIE